MDDISMDLDAYSVVVRAGDTVEAEQGLKKYLMTLGGDGLTRCSFPRNAIASNRKDGIFGCFHSGSKHVPLSLQGNSMLVIDTPVKIALHISCKEALVKCLEEMDFYFKAAGPSSGLCFDPSVCANKPLYSVLVEAIIASCKMSQSVTGLRESYIVHVADLGFRMPLPKQWSQTSKIFLNKCDANNLGITLEVIQCDLAFVTKCEKDNLIQATCSRNSEEDRKCVLQGSSLKVFPIHKLPPLKEKGLDPTKLKGTLQIKKTQWELVESMST